MAFNPNFYNIERGDETYNFKKHYDSNVYVIFPDNNFSIKRGSEKPLFTCFIKQKGEQFGDALPVELPLTYIIRVYDKANNVIVNGLMVGMDENLGEYNYKFNSLDFQNTGNFTCEVIELFEDDEAPTVESIIGKTIINVN